MHNVNNLWENVNDDDDDVTSDKRNFRSTE